MSKDRNDADVAFIQALAELLDTNDLTEVEVKREYGESDRLNVRVSRQKTVVTQASYAVPAMAAAPPAAAAPAVPAPVADADPAAHPGALTSPMVGTCYLSPEPGADPFVKVGDKVAEGQTVLIIEAMKVMNPISAPANGVVKEVLIHDAQPVEFGEPLLVIE